MFALTTGQRLLFAILAAVFVLDVVVTPFIRPKPRRHVERSESHRRLMQEIRRQPKD